MEISKYKESIPEKIYNKYFGKLEKGGKVKLTHGKGCSMCNKTGYLGRIGIFEVIETNEAIRELVMKKTSADLIAKQAYEDGTVSMLEDGMAKVLTGMTTIDEVLRNASLS